MNYVYLMRSGERYKIGRAHNVERRWLTFRTADPSIVVEHVIPSPQAPQLEAALHRKFHHKHIDLEWFALGPRDVAFIRDLGGHSGQWLKRKRWRRLAWRRTKRALWLLTWLAFNAAILYLLWRVIEWSIPYVRQFVRQIG